MTEVVRVSPVDPDPAALARAAACLRGGGLVAFPTETVYGLGVHALDRAAVARLFAAKQRPPNDPLIVHVHSFAAVRPLASRLPEAARTLADRFWPGPLTLVLPRAATVPSEVTAGLPTVAVRVPAHPVARALITAAGIPIAAPSANLFSRPSPTTAGHVLEDLEGRIDMVIDAGPTTIGVESTVLDLTREIPTVLRPGAVTVEMLRQRLPNVEMLAGVDPSDASAEAAMPSPGLLDKHYAPRAPLTLFEGAGALDSLASAARAALASGHRVGVIAADEDRLALSSRVGDDPRVLVRSLGSTRHAQEAASRLYAALRELDSAGVDTILARGFPTERGLGSAVRDRMRRAAAGRVVRS